MKKPNPVIQMAEQRGFEKGLAAGRDQAINFFVDWFSKLEEVPGIGPKTSERIRNEFLRKYGK
jgi:hypothetical protein